MGLNERDAAIICDELEDLTAAVAKPGVLVGLPYDKIGAAGYGVAEVAAPIFRKGLQKNCSFDSRIWGTCKRGCKAT